MSHKCSVCSEYLDVFLERLIKGGKKWIEICCTRPDIVLRIMWVCPHQRQQQQLLTQPSQLIQSWTANQTDAQWTYVISHLDPRLR